MAKKRLSRHERLRRNPLPWLVLLLISGAFFILKVVPQFTEWNDKKSGIKKLEQQVSLLTRETDKLKQQVEDKNLEFNQIAEPFLSEERQTFPKTIDPSKIIRVIELFALQLQNLDSQSGNPYFEISKVGIGEPKKEKGENFSRSTLTIALGSDRENIETFIRFLQTRKLSSRFERGLEKEQIRLIEYKFLKNNLLPVIHIESIKLSPQDEVAANPLAQRYSVQIKAILFSQ